MTTITAPEGFTDWPKPAQRFAMRVFTETSYEIDETSTIQHGNGAESFMIRLNDEDGLYISFRRLPGQGWRFWYGDDGWGHTLRSMREILYRLGSNVEISRVQR